MRRRSGRCCSAADSPANAGVQARALVPAGRRLRRRRLARPRRGCAPAGAVPRSRRLFGQPLRPGVRADARGRGWRFAVPHFRGCSGELNLAPRAYHSGDCEEIGWLLGRFRELHRGTDLRARRFARRQRLAALRRGGRDERAGTGRAVARSRRRSTSPPAAPRRPRLQPAWSTPGYSSLDETQGAAKLAQHPGLFDPSAAPRATCTTSTMSSPRRCTAFATPTTTRRAARPSRSWRRIRIPALVLNARNDPFVPAAALPGPRGRPPGHALAPNTAAMSASPAAAGRAQFITLPEEVIGWLDRIASRAGQAHNSPWTRSSTRR